MDACLRLSGFELLEENSKYPNHTGMKIEVRLANDSEMDVIEPDIAELKWDLIKFDQLEVVDAGEKLVKELLSISRIVYNYVNVNILGKIIKITNFICSDDQRIVVVNWGLEDMGQRRRRHLTILDETGESRVTLWREDADEFGEETKIPIALRKVAVEVYDNRKFLSSTYFTTVWVKTYYIY